MVNASFLPFVTIFSAKLYFLVSSQFNILSLKHDINTFSRWTWVSWLPTDPDGWSLLNYCMAHCGANYTRSGKSITPFHRLSNTSTDEAMMTQMTTKTFQMTSNLVYFVAHKHCDDVVFCWMCFELVDPLVELHERLFIGDVIHWKHSNTTHQQFYVTHWFRHTVVQIYVVHNWTVQKLAFRHSKI